MFNLPRITIAIAGLGGLLWTVKALVITALDGSFDPLESVVFIGGLLLLTTAAVLVAAHLAGRRFRGVARAAATLAGAVGLVAATLLLESVGKAVVGLAPGDNLGLEEEGGILVCGLAWLSLAIAAHRGAAAAPAPAPAPAR
jgi:hypothetical protein